MANIDITDQGGGSLSNGVLQLENGVAMDTTLRYVADQANTKSQLLLATNATTVEGTLKVKTDNVDYIDLEDGSGNNRFTISRPALGQKVTLDFASNPVGSTTIVGSIRTFTDGANLNDIVQFREDGQTTFVERVNVEADSLVTTQTSSVIASTTTNANLVIAPNGTGALVASIPDGTVTGGNARGNNAVDLQMSRLLATQVASGGASVVVGGGQNFASSTGGFVGGGVLNSVSGLDGYQVVVGGQQNTINSSGHSFIGGGLFNSIAVGAFTGGATISGGRSNVANSAYSTVSGGQSNTASTNTHATIVGGQSNTASGAHSIAGGNINTASGTNAIALGYQNTASGNYSFATGFQSTSTKLGSVSLGIIANATGDYSTAIGARSNAYLYGQFANANENFTGAGSGQAQQSLLTARRQATLTTGGTTVLSLDGTGTTNLIIPNGSNRSWNVQVRWVAVVTSITGTATGVTVGDTKTSTDLLAVARRSGNTTVSTHTSAGTHVIETIAGSLTAANIAYTAGASQQMQITFTGPTFAGGGSVTMRVVAAISLTELEY